MINLDLTIKDTGAFIQQGVSYDGLMGSRIKKSGNYLQPLFEAFSNSLEAIKDGEIINMVIELFHSKSNNVLGEGVLSFASLQITDFGEGFTNSSFERFKCLFDKSKDKNNFGTGRIQFLHSFQYTQIVSVFLGEDGKKYSRRILLSKSFEACYKAVICAESPVEVSLETPVATTVAFFNPLNKEDTLKFDECKCDDIKDNLLKRYLNKFCLIRDSLNKININHFINDVPNSDSSCTLSNIDIPQPDYVDSFDVHYSKLSPNGKSIDRCSQAETFEIRGYKLPTSLLPKNEVRLTSKGESFPVTGCEFPLITTAPRIEPSTNFLFLISSDYLTNKDSDVRGLLEVYTKSNFLEKRNIFTNRQEILLDDVEDIVEDKIIHRYPAFKTVKDEANGRIEALARLFSIDMDAMVAANVRCTDSDSVALRKVYTKKADERAENDAAIKKIIDSMEDLDPTDRLFKSQFNKKVVELNGTLPISVKEALSNYVSRRTLVINLLEKALNQQLAIQREAIESKKKGKKTRSKKTKPEAILHNIFFPQHTNSTVESNLWILNDEYIHFSGVSESRLDDVIINGINLFKTELTNEEKEYKFRNQQLLNVGDRRPDILLFPEEGKCVIIEFKAPDVDVSKHLHQISQYATIIYNLCNENLQFNSFYGYLIGENVDKFSVRDADPEFKYSQSLGYFVRPHRAVAGQFGKPDASLYTEILQYSQLLERAKLRNKVFTDRIIDSTKPS